MELKRKAEGKKIKNIVQQFSCVQKSRKICGDPLCPLKQKWKSKLVLEIKDAQEAEKVKISIHNMK
jgi:hypothetical protein